MKISDYVTDRRRCTHKFLLVLLLPYRKKYTRRSRFYDNFPSIKHIVNFFYFPSFFIYTRVLSLLSHNLLRLSRECHIITPGYTGAPCDFSILRCSQFFCEATVFPSRRSIFPTFNFSRHNIFAITYDDFWNNWQVLPTYFIQLCNSIFFKFLFRTCCAKEYILYIYFYFLINNPLVATYITFHITSWIWRVSSNTEILVDVREQTCLFAYNLLQSARLCSVSRALTCFPVPPVYHPMSYPDDALMKRWWNYLFAALKLPNYLGFSLASRSVMENCRHYPRIYIQ